MKLLMNSLKVFVLLGLAAVAGRADDCYSFFADPSTYYGPPGVITAEGNPTFYSFVVTTTYVNNCADPRWLGENSGESGDAMLYGSGWWWSFRAGCGTDNPYCWVAPGESVTRDFAGYVWRPDAPNGYTATIDIYAEGWGWSQFTAIVGEPPVAVPEPGSVLLLGTGLFAIAARLRKAKRVA